MTEIYDNGLGSSLMRFARDFNNFFGALAFTARATIVKMERQQSRYGGWNRNLIHLQTPAGECTIPVSWKAYCRLRVGDEIPIGYRQGRSNYLELRAWRL